MFRRLGRREVASFTLIEMLTAVAVLTLLLLLLAQMLKNSSVAWGQGESAKERLQNERAIGDFITRELTAALMPANRISMSSLDFLVNPQSPTITSATFNIASASSNPDSIFWQAPFATDQTLGDVAEIGYFVKWNTSNAANPRANLCRFFANPGSGATANSNFLIYTNPTSWISDSIISAVAPANQANAYQGLFAENVLGLWATCNDSAGVPIAKTFYGTNFSGCSYDSRAGYIDSLANHSSYYTVSAGSTTTTNVFCVLPPSVTLSLVLLDSSSAAKISPTLQSSIISLVASNTNAAGFVSGAAASSALIPIAKGLRAYQTTVYLQDSK